MAKAAAKKKQTHSKEGDILLETRLTKKQQLELFRWMILNREFDDKISKLFRRGLIVGASFGCLGQEASSCASAYALQDGDCIAPMIRNAGATLIRGVPLKIFLSNYMFRITAPTGGRDGNTHFGDLRYGVFAPISHLGCGLPVISGYVLAARMRGEKRVGLSWIGEGTSSTGEFHEAINFAAVRKSPLVVILENNQVAYSTPREMQSLVKNFADKGIGYGLENCVTVDGNDANQVYETTLDAVARARAGEGTQLFEVLTYRRKGHAEHDGAKYRSQELHDYWVSRDPIDRYGKYLRELGWIDEDGIEQLHLNARKELDDAEDWAAAQPKPDPATVTDAVYAEQRHPAHLDDEFLYGQRYRQH